MRHNHEQINYKYYKLTKATSKGINSGDNLQKNNYSMKLQVKH